MLVEIIILTIHATHMDCNKHVQIGHNSMQTVRSWWHHQMETFSVLLALCEGNPPVNGGFPSQRPVTQSFDVFCLYLNKRLSKQSRCQLFETSSHSLWHHCNVCFCSHLTLTVPLLTWKQDPVFRHESSCHDCGHCFLIIFKITITNTKFVWFHHVEIVLKFGKSTAGCEWNLIGCRVGQVNGLSRNARLGNGGNSVKHNQKLIIRLGKNTIMTLSTTFEINPLNGLSRNGLKPQKCDRWTDGRTNKSISIVPWAGD